MNIYLRWFLVNFGILAMLLSGLDGFVTLALILLWVTAILGCLFISEELSKKVYEKMIEKGDDKGLVNMWLNLAYDVPVVVLLAYMNYPFLAAVYLLHLIGVVNLHKAREQVFVDKLSEAK